MTIEELIWKKYPVLNDGFICLVDVMGDDEAIVQAARVSYGKDDKQYPFPPHYKTTEEWTHATNIYKKEKLDSNAKDRRLIRRLMMDAHTSPFEMVEFKFKVRVPMDCWRQWIRHRTANVNEFSTRYSEAIDSQQTTSPEEWRLQAKNNKQGSSGFLEEWPEEWKLLKSEESDILQRSNDELTVFVDSENYTPGELLTGDENMSHQCSYNNYKLRLALGVAREQARKDLPLSTYTEAYWKCDLHNIFNFLRLRLDSHAQLEIRLYAQAMYEIVKQVCPIACEAFEDYVLHAKKFSRMEMRLLRNMYSFYEDRAQGTSAYEDKPSNMTENEWDSFIKKLQHHEV